MTIDRAAAGGILHAGGLRVLMQPIVDLRSGELRQVEALARLSASGRSDSELLGPQLFLDLLDGSDVDLLFRQVIDETLSWLVAWDAEGLCLSASVNLAPSTLRDPRCPDWVATLLGRYSIGADRLVLELLETDVLDTPGQLHSLRRLEGLGVLIALDDFGTGHSNYSRLAELSVDVVKIDHSLTAGLHGPAGSRDVVRVLVELGRAAGCEVVVEGIEHADQAAAARELGADLGQGFYFARPMPADEVLAWLSDYRERLAQQGASE